jgi:hypothetical protein
VIEIVIHCMNVEGFRVCVSYIVACEPSSSVGEAALVCGGLAESAMVELPKQVNVGYGLMQYVSRD